MDKMQETVKWEVWYDKNVFKGIKSDLGIVVSDGLMDHSVAFHITDLHNKYVLNLDNPRFSWF